MARLFCLLLFVLPWPSLAAPVPYTLIKAQSEVAFSYALSGVRYRGQMPVVHADVVVDLADFQNSRVAITIDARGARAGFIVATEALKAGQLLNVADHPTIQFASTRVRPTDPRDLSKGGHIDGLLTIRGVTQPVTLIAEIEPSGGAGGLSALDIQITGAVRRSDFGADGYPNLVGDVVGLDIRARVSAAVR